MITMDVIAVGTTYYAHSECYGKKEMVIEHITDVARIAAGFASFFGAEREAEVAGFIHDIGKYGDLFQKRLEHKEKGIDHWSMGAWIMLTHFKEYGISGAVAIQGHHIGLQSSSKNYLKEISPKFLMENHPLKLRLSEISEKLILDRYIGDGGKIKEPGYLSDSKYLKSLISKAPVDSMLDIRMLYSTIVDADFISTESHFNRDRFGKRVYRDTGVELNPGKCYEIFESYMSELRKKSSSDYKVNKMREDLLQACIEAGENDRGLYTLSAPTGSGKTLAMLAFALKHALANDLRRIVIVLPYLSIIEQTVDIYKKIFVHMHNDLMPFILEDHSLTHFASETSNNPDEDDISQRNSYMRKFTENWDAPIVITTTVKFFESLFSNKPSACRKLHNLSKSIIMFDEAQTLPVDVIIPTIGALSHLKEEYGCSVVFSTATQPAFNHLNSFVSMYSKNGWKSKEIVKNELGLFGRTKRFETLWPDIDNGMSLKEISDEIANINSILCITNLKRHARQIYQYVNEIDGRNLYHLSTSMCTKHRQDVLKIIKKRLKDGESIRLIATQCVEAGVDVDFPYVYRAWGPLEAMAQAAGRCNREGKLEHGSFIVFMPEKNEEKYPGDVYKQAADVAKIIFRKYNGSIDLQDPKVFEEYYKLLFDFSNPGELNEDLMNYIKTQDFVGTAKEYKIIDKGTINVLVPYEEEIFEELSSEARENGITPKWAVKARPYTISIYRPGKNSAIRNYIQPVGMKKTNSQDEADWFIYLRNEHYDMKLGLIVPEEEDILMA